MLLDDAEFRDVTKETKERRSHIEVEKRVSFKSKPNVYVRIIRMSTTASRFSCSSCC